MSKSANIRRAHPGDEPSIAKVHIQAWQEAYRGLLPQHYLDQLPNELEERNQMWISILKNPNRWTWVAENENGIVGFILFGPPRDENREGFVELGAIYLLASEKGKGIGYSLLQAGFNQMRNLNFKKAYCWVLENNPTIRFYEKSGAKFSGLVKEDEIGGQKANDLAYEWPSLDLGDNKWKPLSVKEVAEIFKKLNAPWWFAGGWAIDLFLGKKNREHEDIDVLILRDDQMKLHDLLEGWDIWAADPPGSLRPWKNGEYLNKGLQDIWARKSFKDPWQIQIMLFDSENGEWIFKRDESIRKGLDAITYQTSEGYKLLAPEVQLLYKSKSLRPKDQLDFENALPHLSETQRNWLKKNLFKLYGESHPWFKQL